MRTSDALSAASQAHVCCLGMAVHFEVHGSLTQIFHVDSENVETLLLSFKPALSWKRTKMASKEATVYIVDVGSTMGERSHGRQGTNLDWALQYVWDRLTTSIATGRKTLFSGVVALRSDVTRNELGSEEQYEHIAVLQDLGQILMPEVRRLRKGLVVSHNGSGDAVSALVIAIQMITRTCKKLQYIRKIVLVTDARAPMQTDDLSSITSKLKEDEIQLLVLGVDFDDADFGFKEESKDPVKAENEGILRQLCEDCNGNFGSLVQAIDELGIPRVKQVKAMPSYKGVLTLGNSEEYDDAFNINVERYPKTMVAHPPSASQFVIRSDLEATQSSATLSNGDSGPEPGPHDGLAPIKNARTYQVEDETAPGGKKDVEIDELAKGYEYGRTAVHISESDQNVTTFETPQGLDIIGFVDAKQYERSFDMSRTNLIIAEKFNEKASMALSSLINALYELESYAVARFVSKTNKQPVIILLAPSIEPDFECLYDVELPFAEDIRPYRFPPLDRVVTVSGKVLKLHRNLPSDELQGAMDDYVDQMDLSSFGKDDEGEPCEYMSMDETYSPVLHHLHRVINHRAVYPDSAPPDPANILTRYSLPPDELVEASRAALDKVISAADVKKVPPKARGKRFGRKEEKPLSELDVGALLAQDPKRKQKCIDRTNAVPEFKQLLSTAESVDELHDACKQLQRIVLDWIRHSVGDSGYGKAVEGIRVMREEMNELEEPSPYNDFLKDLKGKLLGEMLGGDRKQMWWLLRVNRMGPIHKRDCAASDVSEEDAKAFMSAK